MERELTITVDDSLYARLKPMVEDRFNAETIAAFEEGDALLRGELPAKRFDSLDEMLAALAD